MGRMYVLNDTGHDETQWDPDDASSITLAKREFSRLRTCGYLPFKRRTPTEAPVRDTTFDTEAGEIFWVRPLVGG